MDRKGVARSYALAVLCAALGGGIPRLASVPPVAAQTAQVSEAQQFRVVDQRATLASLSGYDTWFQLSSVNFLDPQNMFGAVTTLVRTSTAETAKLVQAVQ